MELLSGAALSGLSDRGPVRFETEGVGIDGDRYWRTVAVTDPGLHDRVQWWLVDLVPWAKQSGFRLNDPDDGTYGAQVWAQALRWLGEGFQVRVSPVERWEFVWATPPLMPPPELVKFTEAWEARMGFFETDEGDA